MPMNRPGVGIVLRGGGWILGPDVVLARSRPTYDATYCHDMLPLCDVLYRRAAVRCGGNRPARGARCAAGWARRSPGRPGWWRQPGGPGRWRPSGDTPAAGVLRRPARGGVRRRIRYRATNRGQGAGRGGEVEGDGRGVPVDVEGVSAQVAARGTCP